MEKEQKLDNNLKHDEVDENQKRKIVALLILLFVVLVSGVTYAFFTATVSGGDKASSININTATLGLRYSEDPITCAANGILPGTSCTHNFYIENTGTVLTNYYAYITDIINTFVTKSDLVYEVTCESVNTVTGVVSGTCSGKSEDTVPDEQELIITQDIDKGLTHKYTITITFKETGVNQNDNQGKTFSGKILVVKDIISTRTPIADVPGTLMPVPYNEYYNSSGKFLNSPSPITRAKIDSVVVLEDAEFIPADVLGSWDVSEEQNGSIMAWYTDTNSNGLYEVTIGQIGGVIANEDSSYLFANLTSAKQIDFHKMDFSDASYLNINYMFYNCTSLPGTDFSDFNGAPTDLVSVFENCYVLQDSPSMFSLIDFSNVYSAERLYANCYGLAYVEFNSPSAGSISILNEMFLNCRKLTFNEETGASSMGTLGNAYVSEMYAMFKGCTSLEGIDLSNFNTRYVTNMSYMFEGCTSLENLDLSNFDTESVWDMTSMFEGCISLENLNISNFATSNSCMDYMFKGCASLEILDLNHLDFSGLSYSNEIFNGCTSLKTLKIIQLNLENFSDTALINMFAGVPDNTEITTNPDSKEHLESWIPRFTNIKI